MTPGRRRWLMLPLLIAAATASGEEAIAPLPTLRPPGIVGEDNRVPVPSNAWPWAAIGRLNRGSAYCTATLIAADTVLTAAHCLYDLRRGADVKAHELHFLAGYRKGEYLAHGMGRSVETGSEAARAARLPRESQAVESRAVLAAVARDWAIVRLQQPLTVRPIPVASPAGTEAVTDTGPVADALLVRAGYSQDRPHMLSVHEGCRVLHRFADFPVLLTDCDATRGDSGSPLLQRNGEQVFVAGVVSAIVTDGAHPGSLAVAASAFAGRIADRR